MPEDQASDRRPPSDPPVAVREWLSDLAEAHGLTEEELIARLVDGGAGADIEAVMGRLDDLEAAVSNLQADVDGKIKDLRERVVQVKREADAKAPADHDHPPVEDAIDQATAEIAAVNAVIDDVEDRMVAGFDNYEAVLEYLVESTDEVEEKLDVLAEILIEVREDVSVLMTDHARQQAVADLSRAAAVHGTSTASCGNCGEAVDISLLVTPRCPHCAEPFTEFSPKEALFDSHVLETGDRPAIEPAEEAESAGSLDGVFGSSAEPPSVEHRLSTRSASASADESAVDSREDPDDDAEEAAEDPFEGWVTAVPNDDDDEPGEVDVREDDAEEDDFVEELDSLFGEDGDD